MEILKLGNIMKSIFIFFIILTSITSTKYKIFETTSEIAFSKIIKYNITLNNKKVDNVSNDLLSTSVLSVIVRVPKGEDCMKKTTVYSCDNRAVVNL